ncbi:MAG: hypothetical protein M3Q60_21950, partial [Actinomycetota bacterium]|nr:hypothetical protein [Actinomycetota bacterium]
GAGEVALADEGQDTAHRVVENSAAVTRLLRGLDKASGLAFGSGFPRRIDAFLDRAPDAFVMAEQPGFAVPGGYASGECSALRGLSDTRKLEAVINSMRNGLGMRKTGDRRKLGQPNNSRSNALFAQVHNTL